MEINLFVTDGHVIQKSVSWCTGKINWLINLSLNMGKKSLMLEKLISFSDFQIFIMQLIFFNSNKFHFKVIMVIVFIMVFFFSLHDLGLCLLCFLVLHICMRMVSVSYGDVSFCCLTLFNRLASKNIVHK